MPYRIILNILIIVPHNLCFYIDTGTATRTRSQSEHIKGVKHLLYCKWIEFSIKSFSLNYFNVLLNYSNNVF